MAVRAALLRGKDISTHMSRSILDLKISSTDCLVAMDLSVLSVSRDIACRIGCQITLMALWGNPPVGEVEDPYGMSLPAFIRCYEKIDKGLDGLSKWIEAGMGKGNNLLKKSSR
jgi:protein-tyrosine-phosphatase